MLQLNAADRQSGVAFVPCNAYIALLATSLNNCGESCMLDGPRTMRTRWLLLLLAAVVPRVSGGPCRTSNVCTHARTQVFHPILLLTCYIKCTPYLDVYKYTMATRMQLLGKFHFLEDLLIDIRPLGQDPKSESLLQLGCECWERPRRNNTRLVCYRVEEKRERKIYTPGSGGNVGTCSLVYTTNLFTAYFYQFTYLKKTKKKTNVILKSLQYFSYFLSGMFTIYIFV